MNPLDQLKRGEPAIWVRSPDKPPVLTLADVTAAQARFRRFESVLRQVFDESGGWDGRIRSALTAIPAPIKHLYAKCDHALPLTGSIKARGGVHELLCLVERIAFREGLLKNESSSYDVLASQKAREVFSRYQVVVASTGNLGFSIGLVGRGFGFESEVHMSRDAKEWKKARLRALGATVIEHACDFNETVDRARRACVGRATAHFVDDEASCDLLLGYAAAAFELAEQLEQQSIRVSAEHPLFVYLPCGVGGSPGGVTFGLKHIFGNAVVCVFVEPIGAASMLVALNAGGHAPIHVSDLGLPSNTIADGLAVPSASPLVLSVVGNMIDAVVAVSDDSMVQWLQRIWKDAGLRLEPSAAAGFAALEPMSKVAESAPAGSALSRWREGVHVAWTTGGSLLPDAEFEALLK